MTSNLDKCEATQILLNPQTVTCYTIYNNRLTDDKYIAVIQSII